MTPHLKGHLAALGTSLMLWAVIIGSVVVALQPNVDPVTTASTN